MIRKLLEQWFRVRAKRNKNDLIQLKQRLAIIYGFIGWNCFGVLFYIIMKKELPEDREARREALGLLTDTSHMHVYQIQGMTLTNDFDITFTKDAQIKKKNEESENAKTDEH